MFREILDDIDFNDYYSLRKGKRTLLSYLNVYDTYKRFLMLKLTPPSNVKDKIDKLERNGITISDIHNYIRVISIKMNELKKGS